MWSKTRQVLESRLADGLKGRVSYHWDVYRRDGKCPTECHVMSIFVDGECWFHTNQRFWDVKYGTRPEPKDNDIIRETGLVENYWGNTVSEYIHQFLNVLSIDEAISMSTNIEMFESVLRMKGYRIKADPSRKYPVICSVYGGKPTRLYHLGEEYDPQRIYERICQNDIEAAEKYYRFLDERRRAYQPPLTPEMKAALRKCDEYSRQARLIGEEHLETTADAEGLIKRYDDQIGRLCEDRQKIRNMLRRCKDPDTISNLKEQRNALSTEIKEIRGKRFTAVQIIERAEKIHEDVARETAAKRQEREVYVRKRGQNIR